jgi:5-methyltetrahydrofolate--homocysteine methyltransferase
MIVMSCWFIEVQYFATDKVDKDQVADYAQRNGWTVEQAGRWLDSVLGY